MSIADRPNLVRKWSYHQNNEKDTTRAADTHLIPLGLLSFLFSARFNNIDMFPDRRALQLPLISLHQLVIPADIGMRMSSSVNVLPKALSQFMLSSSGVVCTHPGICCPQIYASGVPQPKSRIFCLWPTVPLLVCRIVDFI